MSPHARPQPLSIAYIVGSFPHVSETFIVNQIAAVAARGHEVHIFTTCEGVTDDVPEDALRCGLMQRVYPIYAAGHRALAVMRTIGLAFAYGWRAPKLTLRLIKVLRRDGFAGSLRLIYAAFALARRGAPRYDVIHAQLGVYGPLALRLVEIGALRGEIVTSFRGFDAGRVLADDPQAYRELFDRGRLFLPVSGALAQRLANAGCSPSKIRVLHSGIRCRQIRYQPDRAAGEGICLLSVGRLVEKKGIADAIVAAARVAASGRRLSYRIIGDGALRESLTRLIEDHGLRRQVALVGWKRHDDVLQEMRRAHLLIAPSVTAADGDEEGIPNVVKEAMAMGLPVIGTRHGGIPELIEDGVSGVLVPERDADALADAVVRLIQQPEKRAALAQAGRRRIEAEFDIERLTDELIQSYLRVAPASVSLHAGEKTRAPRRWPDVVARCRARLLAAGWSKE